ncbi:hypothetical protein GOODEAATRI_017025, partial [Goodea atripinnis]
MVWKLGPSSTSGVMGPPSMSFYRSKRLSEPALTRQQCGKNMQLNLAGSAAASFRYVITARKRDHIRSGRQDGAEQNLPTKSSDRGRAGWRAESPFTLASSWILLGSSRSSALTAGNGVVADIRRPQVAERQLSSASRLPSWDAVMGLLLPLSLRVESSDSCPTSKREMALSSE